MDKFIKFSTPEVLSGIKKGIVAIGVFDGVHLGHRKVISAARELAKEYSAEVAALTFIPHPRQVLAGNEAVKLLMPEDERLLHLIESGADVTGTIAFSKEIAGWEPERFLDELVNSLPFELKGICVGSNWRFGKHGSGDRNVLTDYCQKHGIAFVPVPVLEYHGATVSSSVIRQLIGDGELALAQELAGRPVQLHGKVVAGMKVAGKELSAPTANLDVTYGVLPPDGVYAGTAELEGEIYPAVLNIGFAPTYNVNVRRVEIHFIGYSGNLYDRELTVFLSKFIRDIRRFSSPEELKQQILSDIAETASAVK